MLKKFACLSAASHFSAVNKQAFMLQICAGKSNVVQNAGAPVQKVSLDP